MSSVPDKNCRSCSVSWTAPVDACPKCGLRGWMLEASNRVLDESVDPRNRLQVVGALLRVNRDSDTPTEVPVLPEGWALMPTIPTTEMLEAANSAHGNGSDFQGIYFAMMDTAPQPEACNPSSLFSTERRTGLHIQVGKLVSEKHEDFCELEYVAAQDALELERDLGLERESHDITKRMLESAVESSSARKATGIKFNAEKYYAEFRSGLYGEGWQRDETTSHEHVDSLEATVNAALNLHGEYLIVPSDGKADG